MLLWPCKIFRVSEVTSYVVMKCGRFEDEPYTVFGYMTFIQRHVHNLAAIVIILFLVPNTTMKAVSP
jgi:hypothetical protein